MGGKKEKRIKAAPGNRRKLTINVVREWGDQKSMGVLGTTHRGLKGPDPKLRGGKNKKRKNRQTMKEANQSLAKIKGERGGNRLWEEERVLWEKIEFFFSKRTKPIYIWPNERGGGGSPQGRKQKKNTSVSTGGSKLRKKEWCFVWEKKGKRN